MFGPEIWWAVRLTALFFLYAAVRQAMGWVGLILAGGCAGLVLLVEWIRAKWGKWPGPTFGLGLNLAIIYLAEILIVAFVAGWIDRD
jgi:hypothetical protein